jgi:hypothetical protein
MSVASAARRYGDSGASMNGNGKMRLAEKDGAEDFIL